MKPTTQQQFKKPSSSPPVPSTSTTSNNNNAPTVNFNNSTSSASSKKSSSFLWNLFKAISKPLAGEQGGYKEQLFQLEDRLRGSRLFWLKSLSVLVLLGYVPYEMRRSMERGKPSEDNVWALVSKRWERSPEKQARIDHLFDVKSEEQ